MDALTSYQHLGRLLAYLRASGAEVDREAFEAAVAMISGEPEECEAPGVVEPVLDWFFARHQRLAGPLPTVAPPLCRGSIGYFSDD